MSREARSILFHPAAILALAAAAAAAFVGLLFPQPRFAGAERFILLYYHAPIAFAFTVYALDRLERWRTIARRQWWVEAPVVALALSRTVAPLPFFSGHALFLSYVIALPARALARWVAGLVFVDVIFFKVFLLHDATLIGGTLIGLLAAALVRRLAPAVPPKYGAHP